MSEKTKIYFVSDVHLGAAALNNNRERELLFAHWLDDISADATALYLMGDIFDFWFEYARVVPRGFTRILGRIATIADRGIPVYFFVGNHDLWVFDYLPSELGVTVVREPVVQEIAGKKFFLAHGDGLDPNDKGYHFLKKIFVNRTLQWLFSRLHPNFALWLAHKWSSHSRLSKVDYSFKFVVNKDGMYKFAADYNEKYPVDFFVMGHRHQLADEQLPGGARFILLGDWINRFSYGVFDGENFELKQYWHISAKANKDIL